MEPTSVPVKDIPPLEALYFRDFKNAYIPEILDEIYIKKIYAPFLAGKKDLIIADWGSNIGLSVFYFKSFGKVYAVEPSIRHLEALETMINYNKLKDVVVCKYAISNKNGKTKFYHSVNTTAYSLTNLEQTQDFEEVETVTVAEFFKRNKLDHLDILKFDVEGAEGEIITSPEFKEYAPKIKVIFGEYHDWTPMGKDMFKNTFEELGFTFTWNHNTKAATFSAVRV